MAMTTDWNIPKEGVVWAAKYSSAGLRRFSMIGVGFSVNSTAPFKTPPTPPPLRKGNSESGHPTPTSHAAVFSPGYDSLPSRLMRVHSAPGHGGQYSRRCSSCQIHGGGWVGGGGGGGGGGGEESAGSTCSRCGSTMGGSVSQSRALSACSSMFKTPTTHCPHPQPTAYSDACSSSSGFTQSRAHSATATTAINSRCEIHGLRRASKSASKETRPCYVSTSPCNSPLPTEANVITSMSTGEKRCWGEMIDLEPVPLPRGSQAATTSQLPSDAIIAKPLPAPEAASEPISATSKQTSETSKQQTPATTAIRPMTAVTRADSAASKPPRAPRRPSSAHSTSLFTTTPSTTSAASTITILNNASFFAPFARSAAARPPGEGDASHFMDSDDCIIDGVSMSQFNVPNPDFSVKSAARRSSRPAGAAHQKTGARGAKNARRRAPHTVGKDRRTPNSPSTTFANELWYQKGGKILAQQRSATVDSQRRSPKLSEEDDTDHEYQLRRLSRPTASSRSRQVTHPPPVPSVSSPSHDHLHNNRPNNNRPNNNRPNNNHSHPNNKRQQCSGPSRVAFSATVHPQQHSFADRFRRFQGQQPVTAVELQYIVGRLSACDPANVPDSGRSRARGKGLSGKDDVMAEV